MSAPGIGLCLSYRSASLQAVTTLLAGEKLQPDGTVNEADVSAALLCLLFCHAAPERLPYVWNLILGDT